MIPVSPMVAWSDEWQLEVQGSSTQSHMMHTLSIFQVFILNNLTLFVRGYWIGIIHLTLQIQTSKINTSMPYEFLIEIQNRVTPVWLVRTTSGLWVLLLLRKMATSTQVSVWDSPKVYKHHEQQAVCHTRPKYRDGRRPKAVKVSTWCHYRIPKQLVWQMKLADPNGITVSCFGNVYGVRGFSQRSVCVKCINMLTCPCRFI